MWSFHLLSAFTVIKDHSAVIFQFPTSQIKARILTIWWWLTKGLLIYLDESVTNNPILCPGNSSTLLDTVAFQRRCHCGSQPWRPAWYCKTDQRPTSDTLGIHFSSQRMEEKPIAICCRGGLPVNSGCWEHTTGEGCCLLALFGSFTEASSCYLGTGCWMKGALGLTWGDLHTLWSCHLWEEKE